MISGPPHTRRAFSWDKAPKAILPLAPPGRGPAPRPALRGGSAPFAVPGSPSKKTPLPPLRRRGVWCIIIQTIWPGTGVGGPRGRPTPPKRKRQAVCGEVGRKSRAVPPLSQSDRRACRVQLHDGWMRAAYLSCLCRAITAGALQGTPFWRGLVLASALPSFHRGILQNFKAETPRDRAAGCPV